MFRCVFIGRYSDSHFVEKASSAEPFCETTLLSKTATVARACELRTLSSHMSLPAVDSIENFPERNVSASDENCSVKRGFSLNLLQFRPRFPSWSRIYEPDRQCKSFREYVTIFQMLAVAKLRWLHCIATLEVLRAMLFVTLQQTYFWWQRSFDVQLPILLCIDYSNFRCTTDWMNTISRC